ncbi:MAG: hypothetical protein ABSG55_10505 [Dehalococcoidia bacterium]|jgi:Tol biopolymer transport system component
MLPLLAVVSACGGSSKQNPTPSPSAAAPTSTAMAVQPTATPSSVSALGKVVYIFEGNVYTVDLPSGSPVQLTTDGTDASPKWSPSGQWIIFTRLHSNWVMRADGTDARVLAEGFAAWSPNEDQIAYTGGPANPNTVFIENADGSGQIALPAPGGTPMALAWSPDSSWIAFVEEGAPPNQYANLWLLPTNGSGANVQRFSTVYYGVFLAGWTADSNFVLYWLEAQFSPSLAADGLPLNVMATGGSVPRQLATSLPYPGILSFASSGAELAITDGTGRESWTNKRIAVVDIVTGKLTDLTPATMAAIDPAWSRDNGQIAFVSEPDKGNTAGADEIPLLADRRIWTMAADGTNQRQVTTDVAYRDERPLWLADGSLILFARVDASLHASLWLVDSAGGAPQHVVDLITGQGQVPDNHGIVSWDTIYDYWAGPPS